MRRISPFALAVIACSMLLAGPLMASSGTLTITPVSGFPHHVVAHIAVVNTSCQLESQCDLSYVDLTVTPCPAGKPCLNGAYHFHTTIPNTATTSVDEAMDLAPGVAYHFGGYWQLVAFLWFPPEQPTCFPMCSIGGDLNPVEYTSALAVADPAGRSAVAVLDPARPNPFRATVAFTLHLPRAGTVRVGVYDPAGRLVKLLLDDHLPAGSIPLQWDARDQNGARVDAGLYLIRTQAGGAVSNQRVIRLN